MRPIGFGQVTFCAGVFSTPGAVVTIARQSTKPGASETATARAVSDRTPLLWLNPRHGPAAAAFKGMRLGRQDLRLAADRWARFAPVLNHYFPEISASAGGVESALREIRPQESGLRSVPGTIFLKEDHLLPIAGSIKARGGVYEVLVFAETLAQKQGLVDDPSSDYLALTSPKARRLFGEYTIVVGSTGNLGFSIGTIARALGFRAEVHMSADAKAWKKQRLRALGVKVVEHAADYSAAVASARALAQSAPQAYFVDDENSEHLFLGYCVAALELQRQLVGLGRVVDLEHPLFVYLPCGVGGAPAGITFGLKLLFGDNVHCFFGEPVEAPCMLVQLLNGTDKAISIHDFGLTGKTEADGLAVAQASMFAARSVEGLVSGVYTMRDKDLLGWVRRMYDVASIQLEPSAAAGFCGPFDHMLGDVAQNYLGNCKLDADLRRSSHIIWATGGGLMPADEFARYLPP